MANKKYICNTPLLIKSNPKKYIPANIKINKKDNIILNIILNFTANLLNSSNKRLKPQPKRKEYKKEYIWIFNFII